MKQLFLQLTLIRLNLIFWTSKMIKQINDLMICYYYEQVPHGDPMLYVDRYPNCICQPN
jgi:hypothetical protein